MELALKIAAGALLVLMLFYMWPTYKRWQEQGPKAREGRLDGRRLATGGRDPAGDPAGAVGTVILGCPQTPARSSRMSGTPGARPR